MKQQLTELVKHLRIRTNFYVRENRYRYANNYEQGAIDTCKEIAKKLEKILSQSANDEIIENAYWKYDALVKGYQSNKHSERDAFKKAVREMLGRVES